MITRPAQAQDKLTNTCRDYLPFSSWPKLTPASLRADFWAAVTTTIITIPQAVAFAILAGLPPQYGLYTAIIPCMVAALFGSSHQLVVGPSTALSLMVFAAIAPLAEPGSPPYIHLVITMSLLAGLIQLALSVARLGALVNFISHSVVVGFTTGAAVLIITSQLPNALGLNVDAGHSFFESGQNLLAALPGTHWPTVFLTLFTCAVSLLFARYAPRWPGLLIAMLLSSLIVAFVPAARTVQVVGSIPTELPPLSIPDISLSAIKDLSSGALAIALVGLVESVSIGRALAARTNQHLNGNREFLGQGLANIAGSFFSCYPATGSFSRSIVNHHAGARTPLAAVISAALIVLVLLFATPFAAYLPTAAIAGILLIVGYQLIDRRHIRIILRTSRQESAVLAITMLATLFVSLEFGIYAGVILSLLLYLNRISHPQIQRCIPDDRLPHRAFTPVRDREHACPQLIIARIDGSFFFGSVNHIAETLRKFDEENPSALVLLICDSVNFCDVAGAEFLAREASRRRRNGGDLFFSGVKPGVMTILEKSGYLKQIGHDHFFSGKRQAIETLFRVLDHEICRRCQARVFTECHALEQARPGTPRNQALS